MTGEGTIEGVRVSPLKTIADDRGSLFHMLRSDNSDFEGFGEVYFSAVKRGAVKAWRRHRKMIQRFAVPVGEVRIVLFDDREGSPTRGRTQEIRTGRGRYALIRIPPMVWYGFQGVGTDESAESLIANCASLPHDPEEIERLPENDPQIPYRWPHA